MNSFLIVEKATSPSASALVLATGVHSPLEERGRLEAELRRAGISGPVFFDLLLSLGTKNRRYFSSYFDGEHLSPLRLVEAAASELASVSAKTLHAHAEELDCSLLGNAMAFAVRKGYVF